MTDATTTILLIRHGQTDWNKAGRWQGHVDIPLNANGRSQAQKLAQRLSTWHIDALLSSDLQRAAETAALVGQPHQLQPQFSALWRERHIGQFEGLTADESRAQFASVWASGRSGQLEPPDGESFADLQQRALQGLDTVLQSHPGQTVAVVSHGQLIHVLLAQVMGIREDIYGRFSVRGNTGLSIIEAKSDRHPVVTRINDTSHLEIRD